MTVGMPLRADRVLRYVNAYCPHCHRDAPERPLGEVDRLSGYLSEEGGRVWLQRGCRVHGLVRTMYDEDAEIMSYLEQWTAPTKVHVPDTLGNYEAAPAGYLQGLGEMQTQHTCILLEDIIDKCNLSCPTCFASSSPDAGGVAEVRDVLANIDQRLEREDGQLDVLMLSGGEPTLHPHLYELIEEILQRNIVRVLINTNGIKIARDDALLGFLARHNQRLEIYLQFDGFEEDTHRHHRDADLRSVKSDAIARLSAAEVFTTLTMTTALGVNDQEIGDVVHFALDTPYVGGVCIQPQFSSGRSVEIDPMDRLTHTGVLKRLGPQTGGLVTWRDLTALPCSHPHCCSVGYMLMSDSGEWRSLVGVIGHERLKENLGLVANRIADRGLPADLRDAVKTSLLGLLSEQSSLTHPTIDTLFKNICENCDIGLSTLMRLASGALPGRRNAMRDLLARRVKRITIKPFMDIDTMIEERLTQCCVHVGTKSEVQHQCAPFCAVQAWGPLGGMKLSRVANEGAVVAGDIRIGVAT